MAASPGYMDIYDDLNLYITPEKFFLEPRDSSQILVIDRTSSEVFIQQNKVQIPSASSRRAVCGLLGSIRLLAGDYLVVATQRIPLGTIAGHVIFQLAGFDLLPYVRTTLHLSEEQINDNKKYLGMIEQVLDTPHMYFSYSYDLTHTFQRLHNITPDFLQMSVLERADQRFVWNSELLKIFNRPEFKQFCLPIMQGFISINQCSVNGQPFIWTLVSRRSTQRAGTRMFRRGADENGNVANFVETEQIVEYQGDRASFVQTRGSIPLFWQQLPDLRYKPPPSLIPLGDHITTCIKHLDSQVLLYGRQVLVNLVDQRGAELVLENAYRKTVAQINNPNVRYEAFDFHAECGRMRWDRLSILAARLAHEQDDMSWFMLTRDASLASVQDGVFRTNCIDCLDRTNVVQSMLARRALTAALRRFGALKQGQSVEDQVALEALFKEVWADNADMVSIQYSGTGALKTDFTRTGKRTKVGMLRDGINSMTRYYKNNFCDGFRQDAIDLFLGNYRVYNITDPNFSPFKVERGWRYAALPSVLLVAIAMFVLCGVLPAEYSTETLVYILFWGSMVMATGIFIMRHGTEFVDRPKLCWNN